MPFELKLENTLDFYCLTMAESGILSIDYQKALSINRAKIDLLLSSRRLKDCFQFENVTNFLDSLDLRTLVLFRLILEYKIKYPPIVIKIHKTEFRDHIKNGDLSIPIDVCTVLVRSGIILPLANEDYRATWLLLNNLKGRCKFIIFPDIES